MSRGQRRVRRAITATAALMVGVLAMQLPSWSLVPLTVVVVFMAVVANMGGRS